MCTLIKHTATRSLRFKKARRQPRSARVNRSLLAQPPDQHINPVLPKKRLVIDHHAGHAPVTGGFKFCTVIINLQIEAVGILIGDQGHFVEIQL